MENIDFVKQHNEANVKIHEAMKELPHQELIYEYTPNFSRGGDKITYGIIYYIPFTVKDTDIMWVPVSSWNVRDYKQLDPEKVKEYKLPATGVLNLDVSVNIKDCKIKYKLTGYHVRSVGHGNGPLEYRYTNDTSGNDSVEYIFSKHIGWRSDSTKGDALGRKTNDVEFINYAVNSIIETVLEDSKSKALAVINNLQTYKTLKKLK